MSLIWIEETCLWGSFEACLCSDTCKWLDSVVFLVKDEKPLFSSRSTVCLGCKRTTSGTVKNDRLYPNLRKKRTFRNATTGLPAKWRLRNDRRNSILMTRHYPGARFSKGPPKNLSGPIARANFKIRSCWIAAQFLARKPVNFLRLLIVSIYHLQLWSWMQTRQHKTVFRVRKGAGTFEKRAPDLSSAFDWLKQVSLEAQPNQKQYPADLGKKGHVCTHQYRISMLVPLTSSRRKTSGDVAKCRFFSKGGGSYGIITVKPWWECTIRCFSFTSHKGSTTLKIKESTLDVVQKVLWATTNPLSFFNCFSCTTI